LGCKILRAVLQVKEQDRTNAHRLLLFYAVECGLKVLIMKVKRQSRTDDLDSDILTHDINKLLNELHAQGDLVLRQTQMVPIKKSNRKSKDTRTVEPKDFNQMYSRFKFFLPKKLEPRMLWWSVRW
jgi:hypothetical protein